MSSYTNWLGSFAESKVITEFIKHKFDIFLPFYGDSPFDIFAYKDNISYRVQVKATTQHPTPGSYMVDLRSRRLGSNGNCVIKHFNRTSCDLLAIYIQPIDTICFINTKDLEDRSSIMFRKTTPKRPNQYRHWMISDYVDLEKAL